MAEVAEEEAENLLVKEKAVDLEDAGKEVLRVEEDPTDAPLTNDFLIDRIEQIEILAVVLEKKDHLVVLEENVEKAKYHNYKIY